MEETFYGCDYQISNSDKVYKFATEICKLNKSPNEMFISIALNFKGAVIGYSVISIGDLCSTSTHPREVFKFLISCNAGAVIFIHNHPSEDCTASTVDIETTKRLVAAGEILGIPVIDHVIVGGNHYISMREKNLI